MDLPRKVLTAALELRQPNRPSPKLYSSQIEKRDRLLVATSDCRRALTCSNDRHRQAGH